MLLMGVLAAPAPIPPAPVKPPTVRVIGLVTHQADKRCLPEWRSEWINDHHQVGFTRVISGDTPLVHLRGKVALVEGRRARTLPPPVKHLADCVKRQMRSDWVEGPRGMRVKRTGMGITPPMHITHATEIHGFRASVDGANLVVVFENPLKSPIPKLKFRAWYEGCYGKPNVATEEAAFLDVRPGASVTARFPLQVIRERGRGRHHAISSIQVDGEHPSVVFDLDVSVRRLGADVTGCRRR